MLLPRPVPTPEPTPPPVPGPAPVVPVLPLPSPTLGVVTGALTGGAGITGDSTGGFGSAGLTGVTESGFGFGRTGGSDLTRTNSRCSWREPDPFAPPPPPPAGPGPPPPVTEIRGSDDRRQNKKKDQCVHEQRRNDPFPIPPLLLFLLEGGIARSYFTSFGVIAITLTPAPRAASIALITSEYFTAGSPLTKMILSGRPS